MMSIALDIFCHRQNRDHKALLYDIICIISVGCIRQARELLKEMTGHDLSQTTNETFQLLFPLVAWEELLVKSLSSSKAEVTNQTFMKSVSFCGSFSLLIKGFVNRHCQIECTTDQEAR